MQKVIYRSEIEKYEEQIDQEIISHIEEGLIETFEGFAHYSLVAFDWYDIEKLEQDPSQIIIYIDQDDFFVICENELSLEAAKLYFTEAETNERAMYLFFKNMFRGDTKNLEALEDQISNLDDLIMEGKKDDTDARKEIVDIRYDVLRLKKYYEQFEMVFEELCNNDNDILTDTYLNYFEILRNRTDRMRQEVMNLREYIVSVRESYQAQIDIVQNRLMKIFTVVTSIFMPLSLIAGWYGMNLKMPEFAWDYGYPIIIGICIIVTVVWFVVFKKKGWFK